MTIIQDSDPAPIIDTGFWISSHSYDCGCEEQVQEADNDEGYNHRFQFCIGHDPIPLVDEVIRTSKPDGMIHKPLGNCGCIQEKVLMSSEWGRQFIKTSKLE